MCCWVQCDEGAGHGYKDVGVGSCFGCGFEVYGGEFDEGVWVLRFRFMIWLGVRIWIFFLDAYSFNVVCS